MLDAARWTKAIATLTPQDFSDGNDHRPLLENLIETKAVFQVEIKEQRRTVERLKETTWGVVLHEGEEGRRFVVLPAGSLPNPPWTVGGRPAVPLFSE